MNWFDVALIGVGLSMDACAVAVSNGMTYRALSTAKRTSMPLCFSIFQMIMPMMGYHVGNLFAAWIAQCAGVLIFCLLVLIGGKMIWDGCHRESEEAPEGDLSWGMMLFQAVATSIDAFAVGIGFSAAGIALLPACALIGTATLILCCAAVAAGRFFGRLLEEKAQIVGGAVLILIGIKSILV